MAKRACIAFLWLGLVAALSATLEYLSADEMIDQSTAIVRVRVMGSGARQHGPLVYTHYTLQVLEQLKGRDAERIDIVVPGGAVGGLQQTFAGAPVLIKGGEYLLFLWTGPSGLTHVLGFSQGVYQMTLDSGGEAMAARPASAETMLDPKSSRMIDDQPVRVRLSDLRSRVSSRAVAMGGVR
jgi:hypothetical protein